MTPFERLPLDGLRTGLRTTWFRLAVTLALGAAGGAVFYALSLPLAWMLGATLAVVTASFAGLPVTLPNHFRGVFVTVLGVLLGSAFTPDLIEQAARLGASLAVQVVFMALATGLGFLVYRYLAGYDRTTAYFSSTPGGLSEMTLVAEALGGDSRIVPMNHTVRIVLLVTVVPFYFRYVEGLDVPSAPPTGAHAASHPLDVAILIACAAVGYLGALKLKAPAPALMGPMILSALVHAFGVTGATVPSWLVSAAMVVVGAAIGTRFTRRMGPRAMARLVGFAALAATLTIGLAILVAAAVSPLLSVDGFLMFLAIAPGGLAEMSLIAFALAVDSSFVTIMQFVRVAIVMLGGAFAHRLLFGRSRRPSAAD